MVFARVYPRESEKAAHDDALSFERALWALGASIRETRHTDSEAENIPYYELEISGLDQDTMLDTFFQMNDQELFPKSQWFLFPALSENGSTNNGLSIVCCEVCHEPVGQTVCNHCATIEGGTGE